MTYVTICNAVECFSAIHGKNSGEIMTRALRAAMLLVFPAVTLAAPPRIPAEIAAPAGEKIVLKAHATGAQIYTCKPATDGTQQWTLKAPDADLHDKKGAVIGHHFAGPTWQHADGSQVTGKASAHADSPGADSIPWLLVAATGHTGDGVFAKVSSIQRLNTKGGKPPAAAQCDASKSGTDVKSAYSADYYFYAPGK
jgi:hypothetical protein